MKIGILTFHRACNLGGILQCYALSHYLTQIGLEAEVIDYHSVAIDSAYKLIYTNSLRSFGGSFIRLWSNYRIKKNFKVFVKNNIPVSQREYKSPLELKDEYDLIFIGSDQVWSKRLNHGFDSFFWGDIPGTQRIVSYAASMGTDHNFSAEENNLITGYLNNFYAISVREDSLKKALSILTNKDIVTTVDPTLLLSIDDYQRIALYPRQSRYVLYYQMEYNPASKLRVIEVAKELDCEVVVIGGGKEKYDIKTTFLTTAQVSPQLFVGYILNAQCVFASSFHGVALSIAMKKDFYFLANFETDRAENLLKYVGLTNRRVDSNDKLNYSAIDYSTVNPKLDSFLKQSKEFINNCIKE